MWCSPRSLVFAITTTRVRCLCAARDEHGLCVSDHGSVLALAFVGAVGEAFEVRDDAAANQLRSRGARDVRTGSQRLPAEVVVIVLHSLYDDLKRRVVYSRRAAPIRSERREVGERGHGDDLDLVGLLRRYRTARRAVRREGPHAIDHVHPMTVREELLVHGTVRP